jgi:hypothetical protein
MWLVYLRTVVCTELPANRRETRTGSLFILNQRKKLFSTADSRRALGMLMPHLTVFFEAFDVSPFCGSARTQNPSSCHVVENTLGLHSVPDLDHS